MTAGEWIVKTELVGYTFFFFFVVVKNLRLTFAFLFIVRVKLSKIVLLPDVKPPGT